MTHEDFRYVPESEFTHTSHGPLPVQPEAKALRKGNELARQAASLAWRISNEEPDPAKWRVLIEAQPEEMRECLRAHLVTQFNRLKERRRREAGKRSAAGDAAMAELGKRYGAA